MPEGPECRSTADDLNAIYPGKTLVSITWDQTSKHFSDQEDSYNQLLHLLPRKLLQVFTHGKKIIFHLEGDIFMVSFMGMTGTWNQILNNRNGDSLKHIRVTLSFGSRCGYINLIESRAYYNDKMAGGRFNIGFDHQGLNKICKAIGPDLLEYAISRKGNASYEDWYREIKNPKKCEKYIAWFLLEQKYFSGIGNYLRAEILYYAQISPFRQLKNLSDPEIKLLWETSLYIIHKAYIERGHTSNDYFDVHGQPGKFKTLVYGEKFDPNGYPVSTDPLDNRTVHWVPALQR